MSMPMFEYRLLTPYKRQLLADLHADPRRQQLAIEIELRFDEATRNRLYFTRWLVATGRLPRQ